MPRAPNRRRLTPLTPRKRGTPGRPLACLLHTLPGLVPLATVLARRPPRVSPAPLIRKVYIDDQSQPPQLRIQQALVLIGLPRERVYATQTEGDARARKGTHAHRTTGFWHQREEVLQALAEDMRRIYRAHMQQVHPDHGGQHEAAALLVNAFTRAKKLFRAHGVYM